MVKTIKYVSLNLKITFIISIQNTTVNKYNSSTFRVANIDEEILGNIFNYAVKQTPAETIINCAGAPGGNIEFQIADQMVISITLGHQVIILNFRG